MISCYQSAVVARLPNAMLNGYKTLVYGGALVAGLGVTAAYVVHAKRLPRGPERRSWEGLVFGHRGCRFVDGIIENTLAAYEYALDRGADGIEIDVRLCKTGELVVYHDALTSLQAEGPERVTSDMTFDEIQAVQFAKSSTKPARPPLLHEVLELCVRRNTRLLLEVKHYSWFEIEDVLREIRKLTTGPFADFMYAHVTIISFNPYLCYRIRKDDAKLAVCPIYDDSTVSGIAFGSCDVNVYKPLQFMFPGFLDRLFFTACDRWAAWFMGASMVGTRLNLCTAEMCDRHAAAGRIVYLWGLKKSLPDGLRNSKVFVSCDDDHEVLKGDMRKRRPIL